MRNKRSRRRFLKETGAAVMGIGLLPRRASPQATAVDPKRLVAVLGDALIPTAPQDPGYKSLESYGISEEVAKNLRGISQDEFTVFNEAPRAFFSRKSFVDLNEQERAKFLDMLVESFPPGFFGVLELSQVSYGRAAGELAGQAAGGALMAKLGNEGMRTLQKVFRLVRTNVLTIFYQNFPHHRVERDKDKIPILKPGDEHQILNPNTPGLITGWDIAGFAGPLSWDEEEARRAKWMKIHWHRD